jgi:WD40 repeat protein
MSGVPDIVKDAYLMLRGRAVPPEPTRTMQEHTGRVRAAAFFKDGRRVVTGAYDCTVRIWDVEKGKLVGVPFEGHRRWVQCLSISPEETRIASGGDDNKVIIWDVESNQKVLQLNNGERVWSLCFSPDGTKLAAGGEKPDGTVTIWDTKAGTVLQTFKENYGNIYSLAFSPDGLKLASVARDAIRVCHTDDVAKVLLEVQVEKTFISPTRHHIVWSHDGEQIISASEQSKSVRFWRSSDGDQIGKRCIGHTYDITSLAISSGGSFIATASLDGTVRLWDTKTHKQIGQSLEHDVGLHSVAISPNEELVVSGDNDGIVWLWSIKNIREQYQAEERILEDERLRLLFGSDMQVF